jgi:hypothetical protein
MRSLRDRNDLLVERLSPFAHRGVDPLKDLDRTWAQQAGPAAPSMGRTQADSRKPP